MNRIRDLRTAAGWTQAQLGEKLNVGNTAISQYESETRQLDPATIDALCDIFGCTSDYLLGRSPMPSPDLSEEEAEMVLAFRRADDRAREIVRLTLGPFTAQATSAEQAE